MASNRHSVTRMTPLPPEMCPWNLWEFDRGPYSRGVMYLIMYALSKHACERVSNQHVCEWVSNQRACERFSKQHVCKRVTNKNACERVSNKDACEGVSNKNSHECVFNPYTLVSIFENLWPHKGLFFFVSRPDSQGPCWKHGYPYAGPFPHPPFHVFFLPTPPPPSHSYFSVPSL
jgi:hypothetical protein